MRASTAAVLALIGTLIVGCDDSDGAGSVPTGSRPPEATAAVQASTTTAPSTVALDQPAGGATWPAVGDGADERLRDEVVLDCGHSIASLSEPDGGVEVVLDAAALQTSARSPTALQTQATASGDPRTRLWAKSGLVIRGGAQFELAVPAAVADRFSLGWGSPALMTRRIVVPGCGREGEWLAFAGGFSGSEVGCVPVEVVAGGSTQTVTIGFGAPCPGQIPPPEPTDI